MTGQLQAGGRVSRPVPGWSPLAVVLQQVQGQWGHEFWFSVVDERVARQAFVVPDLGASEDSLRQVVRQASRYLIEQLLEVKGTHLEVADDEASLTAKVRVLPGAAPRPLSVDRLKVALDEAADAVNIGMLLLGCRLPVLAPDISAALESTKTDPAFAFDITRHLAALNSLYLLARERSYVTLTVPEGSGRTFAVAYCTKEVGTEALVKRGNAEFLGAVAPKDALAMVLSERLAGLILDWVPGDRRALSFDRSQVGSSYIAAKIPEWRVREAWWVIGQPPLALAIPYAPKRMAVCAFTSADLARGYAESSRHSAGASAAGVRAVSREDLGRLCLDARSGALVVDAGTRTSAAIEGANVAELLQM